MRSLLKKTILHHSDNNYDPINYIFWLLFFAKNTLKYILSILLTINEFKHFISLFIMLIFPAIKFALIGIKNIKFFKTTPLKRTNFIIAMTIIIIWESLCTVPTQYLFPTKFIYPFSIYKSIFDDKTFLEMELFGEIFENIVVLAIFVIYYLHCNFYKTLNLITCISILIFFIFFVLAEIFLFLYREELIPLKILENINEKLRKNTQNTIQENKRFNKNDSSINKNQFNYTSLDAFEQNDFINNEVLVNENDHDKKFTNNTINNYRAVNSVNSLESKNGLIKEPDKFDLPHKFEINLPHIQKIYDNENNNYIRNYFEKKNRENNNDSVKIDPRAFHVEAITDDFNNFFDKIPSNQAINMKNENISIN